MSPIESTARFTLNNASLHYATQVALDRLSLRIDDGEKVAIVGPSGAGKSSLLSTLFQQHPNDIALCPQDEALVDILSVYHNIYMGQLEAHSVFYNLFNLVRAFAKPKAEVASLTHELGIDDKLGHSVDQLSGGQRQRVAIGRALYRQKPIFLGDEPVSSLDPVQSHTILSNVLQAHETAIVALHDVDLAVDLFDRIIGLQNGQLLFDLPANLVSKNHLATLYHDQQ